MTEIQTNQLPEDMISVSDLDVLTWFGISDFGIRISADSLFLILHPMLLRLGVPKAREYLITIRKAILILSVIDINGVGAGKLTDRKIEDSERMKMKRRW